MRTILFLGLSLIITFNFSCKLQKDQSNKIDSKTDTVKDIIITDPTNIPASAVVTINSISITDDILSISLSYSGGCMKHEFNLYFNGSYQKSLPPKAQFNLQHINNADECRSLIDTTLNFNITKARYEGQSELIIRIAEFDQQVNYKY